MTDLRLNEYEIRVLNYIVTRTDELKILDSGPDDPHHYALNSAQYELLLLGRKIEDGTY